MVMESGNFPLSVLKNLRLEPKPGALQCRKNLANPKLAIFHLELEKPNLT